MPMPTITLTDRERSLLLLALHRLRIEGNTGALRALGITTVQGFDHARFALTERLAGPVTDEARRP